jgi:hypothetical protein
MLAVLEEEPVIINFEEAKRRLLGGVETENRLRVYDESDRNNEERH